FRKSDEARTAVGIIVILVAIALLAGFFELKILEWVAQLAAVVFVVVLVVAYQPEIRRTMGEIANNGIFFFSGNRAADLKDQLEQAVRQLSSKRFGALIAIERRVDLRTALETGVAIDAKFTPELLLTIFHSRTALHDGGIILRDGRIRGAGCVFPVTQRELTDRSLGLRHRAAIGITEESDALAISVSEETGQISLAHKGVLEQDLEVEEMSQRLGELLESKDEETEEEAAELASAEKPKRTEDNATLAATATQRLT
ncbi:MAG: diadenylate cyclase CdaA, partial [Verrucomicrobiota bacterium]